MKIIKEKISLDELKDIAKKQFGDMVKAVVDVEQKIMAVGGDLHADEEALLLEQGSNQENLWGINLYLNMPKDQFVEFDSMINIRPRQNNRSKGVEDLKMQKAIIEIVNKLVE
ncbi:MAG: hypothetical protein HYZ51_00850 [Candidatus Doudnabacteria bacterium]|nr:hypothetical protein [Candidatus Doudnabacteria bacterium]